MSHELLETKPTGFFDDLCETRVATLSYELSELTGEPFWEAHGDVSVPHSGMNLPRLNQLKLFDSSSAGVLHEVGDAGVAMTLNEFLDVLVEILRNRCGSPASLRAPYWWHLPTTR
jgi:hypothetical protein